MAGVSGFREFGVSGFREVGVSGFREFGVPGFRACFQALRSQQAKDEIQ